MKRMHIVLMELFKQDKHCRIFTALLELFRPEKCCRAKDSSFVIFYKESNLSVGDGNPHKEPFGVGLLG